MPTFKLTSQVTVTYEHQVEAETLVEAMTMVEDGDNEGVETDSSPHTVPLHDGRPCNTDLFLVHIMEHEEDHYDLRQRIQDWIEGAWDDSLDGLPLME